MMEDASAVKYRQKGNILEESPLTTKIYNLSLMSKNNRASTTRVSTRSSATRTITTLVDDESNNGGNFLKTKRFGNTNYNSSSSSNHISSTKRIVNGNSGDYIQKANNVDEYDYDNDENIVPSSTSSSSSSFIQRLLSLSAWRDRLYFVQTNIFKLMVLICSPVYWFTVNCFVFEKWLLASPSTTNDPSHSSSPNRYSYDVSEDDEDGGGNIALGHQYGSSGVSTTSSRITQQSPSLQYNGRRRTVATINNYTPSGKTKTNGIIGNCRAAAAGISTPNNYNNKSKSNWSSTFICVAKMKGHDTLNRLHVVRKFFYNILTNIYSSSSLYLFSFLSFFSEKYKQFPHNAASNIEQIFKRLYRSIFIGGGILGLLILLLLFLVSSLFSPTTTVLREESTVVHPAVPYIKNIDYIEDSIQNDEISYFKSQSLPPHSASDSVNDEPRQVQPQLPLPPTPTPTPEPIIITKIETQPPKIYYVEKKDPGIRDELNKINARIKSLEAILSKCDCKPQIISQISSTGSGISLDEVEKLIKDAISKYDADKTGLPDLALESAGGSILGTKCTKFSPRRNSVLSIFGFNIWSMPNNPRVIIQPGVVPGECWAFEGSIGDIVLKLVGPSIITGFTMEHIPKIISPYGNIDSAPYKFQVLGLQSENDVDNIWDFGTYSYEDNNEPMQYFQVQNPSNTPYPIIELKILSNHGNLEFTCLYRFRVHGQGFNILLTQTEETEAKNED